MKEGLYFIVIWKLFPFSLVLLVFYRFEIPNRLFQIFGHHKEKQTSPPHTQNLQKENYFKLNRNKNTYTMLGSSSATTSNDFFLLESLGILVILGFVCNPIEKQRQANAY